MANEPIDPPHEAVVHVLLLLCLMLIVLLLGLAGECRC